MSYLLVSLVSLAIGLVAGALVWRKNGAAAEAKAKSL